MSRGPPSRGRNLGRGTGLPGCAVGVPFRHIRPRVGPGPSCWLIRGTGRIQARGRGTSQTRPRDQGEVQTAEAINAERSPPGAGVTNTMSVQPGWGDGHRRREEGAAELGGRPQGQVSWSRASRVILFHVTSADGAFAPPHSHLGAPHGQEAAVAGSARGRDCPGCPGPCCPAHTGPGLGHAPPRPRPTKTPPRQDPAPPRPRPRGGRRGAGRAPTCSYVGTSRRAGRTLAEHLPAGASRGGRRQAWLRRRRRRLVGLVQGRWWPCGAAAGLRLGGGRARAPHGPYAQHLGPPRT